MKSRSYIPAIVIAALVFITGLLLGAGKSSGDTSAANTASKIMLTIGLIAVVATTVLEVVRRRRQRRVAGAGQISQVRTD